MHILKKITACLLVLSTLTAIAQPKAKPKAAVKKPVAVKPVKPLIQTLQFTLNDNTDYGREVLYTGEVKNGKANGYGRAFISYGDITDTTKDHLGLYTGYWKDNAFNGTGDLRGNFNGFSTGKTMYTGEFENGKYHGKGKLWPMYNNLKEGSFVQGVYVEGSAPAKLAEPGLSKEAAQKIVDENYEKTSKANAAKAAQNTGTFTSPAGLRSRPPAEMFYAGTADFAGVDWEALGRKPFEPGYIRPEKIIFLEDVSKDIREHLNETYTYNGGTYKRYKVSKNVENSYNSSIYSGQTATLTGKSTPVVILTYCKGFGSKAKAKVVVNYDGAGKKTDKTVLTGATCNVVTQCTAGICKTVCNGQLEVEYGSSETLWLYREGEWSGKEYVYWVVLTDMKQ